MKNRVTVLSFDRRFVSYEKQLESITLSALEYLKKKDINVDVFLIGNPRMRDLQKTYRGKDKSTNVLSFEAPDFPGSGLSPRQIGEIYLCPPYISENGEDIEFMLIHGLLHLLNFNHETKSDRIVMETTEKKIATWLSHKS